MTVSKTTARWDATGDGSTTVFPYDNKIFSSSDLKVYLDGVLQGSGYTVSGAGSADGGNVTFTTAPGSGVAVSIVRRVGNTQDVDYVENDAFPVEATENALDRRTMVAQDLRHDVDRAVALPSDEAAGATIALPSKASRASKYLGFDSLGNLVAIAAEAGAAVVSAFGATLVAAASAAAARTLLLLDQVVMLGAAASKIRIFEVDDASATYVGDGGGPYDISWMNGWWLTWNLEWDDDEGVLSRFEASKNSTGVFLHIATDHFPFETFRALWFGRVQGASSASVAQSPDRLVSPTAGQVGGCELIAVFTDEGQIALGGSIVEQDGDGSTIGFKRLLMQAIGTKWYAGTILNAYAQRNDTDTTDDPSGYYGMEATQSGGTVTALDFVIEYAAPTTGAPSFSDVLRIPMDEGRHGVLRRGTAVEKSPFTVNTQTAGSHGLGAVPAFCVAELVCLTDELGYVAGDRLEIPIGGNLAVSGSNCIVSVEKTATQVILTISNDTVPTIARGDTNAKAAITAANWKITVTPYAYV